MDLFDLCIRVITVAGTALVLFMFGLLAYGLLVMVIGGG